jgi:hypothetical protein
MRLQEDMPPRAQGEEVLKPDAPTHAKVDAPPAASTETHPPSSSPPVREIEARVSEPRLANAPATPTAGAGGQEARRAASLQLPAASIDALIRRADSMYALGDISAARLLYSRAAMAGSGQATLALGKTYDPLFLADIGVRGMQGDAAVAIEWYRRALALGVAGARERLALHGVHPEE